MPVSRSCPRLKSGLEDEMDDNNNLLSMTADIGSACVGTNNVRMAELPDWEWD